MALGEIVPQFDEACEPYSRLVMPTEQPESSAIVSRQRQLNELVRRFARTKEYVAVVACGFIFSMTAVVTSDGVYDKEIPVRLTRLALEKYAAELPPAEAERLLRWADRAVIPYQDAGPDGILTVQEALTAQAMYEASVQTARRPSKG